MKPEAQRIAIHKALGITGIVVSVFSYQTGKQEPAFWDDPMKSPDFIPDYLNDLNAMHDAEKVLTSKQCEQYFGRLATYPYDRDAGLGASAWQAHATAAQRAEAFLRTIGKWEDGK